ncbi:hypothetical protein U0070_016324 [Myodes glareolus]|uniref:UBC core domain-containing protein n=1 Tax=Myodes glareolus TaxID=447135 RepID=A0AAW0HKF8_MYOGA
MSLSPCYHPSVDTQGNICLDILKDKWSPLYDVRTILLYTQSLLGESTIDSPGHTYAAEPCQAPGTSEVPTRNLFKAGLQSGAVKQAVQPLFHVILFLR